MNLKEKNPMTNSQVPNRPPSKPIKWYTKRVERAMRAILADVRAGRVPADLASWSDLDDYINDCSAGIFDFYDEINDSRGDDQDDAIAGTNVAADMVDAWIRSGGIAATIAAPQRSKVRH
jgi:hypothetical protein